MCFFMYVCAYVFVCFHVCMCVRVCVRQGVCACVLVRVCVRAYERVCIGYTLGSQCIPGIYARWFLITHGVISKPPRVFPGIHGYLGYNQFVG